MKIYLLKLSTVLYFLILSCDSSIDSSSTYGCKITFDRSTLYAGNACKNTVDININTLFEAHLSDSITFIGELNQVKLHQTKFKPQMSRAYVEKISINLSEDYVQDSSWLKITIEKDNEVIETDSLQIVFLEEGSQVEFIKFNFRRHKVPGTETDSMLPYHVCTDNYEGWPLSGEYKYSISEYIEIIDTYRRGNKLYRTFSIENLKLINSTNPKNIAVDPKISRTYEIDPRFKLKEEKIVRTFLRNGRIKTEKIFKGKKTVVDDDLVRVDFYVWNLSGKAGIPGYSIDYCLGGEKIKGTLRSCDNMEISSIEKLYLPVSFLPGQLCDAEVESI